MKAIVNDANILIDLVELRLLPHFFQINTLRKFAKAQNLEVHGHLWVFDNLVDNKIIGGQRAIEKLRELCEIINPKLGLPKNECLSRFEKWTRI